MATSTIGTGGDYATLAAWQTAKKSSGVAETAQLKSSGSHLSSAFTLSDGWGGAVVIEPESGNEHGGQFGSGIVIDPNASGSHVFLIQEDTQNVTIRGICITNSSAGTSDEGIRVAPAAASGTSTYTIEKCLIYDLTTGSCDGIYAYTNDPVIVVQNCAFKNINRAQIHIQYFNANQGDATLTVRHCTFYGGTSGSTSSDYGIGFYCQNGNSATATVYNSVFGGAFDNWAMGITSNGLDNSITITIDNTHCHDDSWDTTSAHADVASFTENGTCFDDVDGYDFSTSTAASNFIVTTLTAGSEDLHLVSHANNVLIDAGDGADAPSTGEDWEGDTRATTGTANVDVGADEYAAGGVDQTASPVAASTAAVVSPAQTVGAVAQTSSPAAAATSVVVAPAQSGSAGQTTAPVAASVSAVPAPAQSLGAVSQTVGGVLSSVAAVPDASQTVGAVGLTASPVAGATAAVVAPAQTLGAIAQTASPAAASTAVVVAPAQAQGGTSHTADPVSSVAAAVPSPAQTLGAIAQTTASVAAPTAVVVQPAQTLGTASQTASAVASSTGVVTAPDQSTGATHQASVVAASTAAVPGPAQTLGTVSQLAAAVVASVSLAVAPAQTLGTVAQTASPVAASAAVVPGPEQVEGKFQTTDPVTAAVTVVVAPAQTVGSVSLTASPVVAQTATVLAPAQTSTSATSTTVASVVNVANFTPWKRREIATTVISLPAGYWVEGSGLGLKAVDPLGDGTDYDCEWYPLGPKRSDGSYRKLRVLFPVEVDAGVHRSSRGDQIPYEYYRLKQVSLEFITRATSIPTWTQHSNVDLSGLSCTFSYACARSGYGATPTRSVTFQGDAGYVMQQVTGSIDRSTTELDTSWEAKGTGRWVRSWIIPCRALPEFMGGTVNEASMYGRLIIEVPTAAVSGIGPNVKMWWEWGNSLVTSDDPNHPTSPARDKGHTAYLFNQGVAGPRLQISGASFSMFAPDAFWESNPSVSSGTTTVPLIEIGYSTPSGNGPNEFRIGTQRVLCGVLSFGSLTTGTVEQTSWRAAQHQNGDQPWMDAVSSNWADHDNYMAFGVVPTWEWGPWTDAAHMFESASKLAYQDRENYRTREPWRISRHGTAERPGIAGGQNGFGNIACLTGAMAGFPDLRGFRLSAFLEPSHGYSHRLVDGSPYDPSTRRTATGPSSSFTHVVSWPSGLPQTTRGAYAPWADMLGKDNSGEDNQNWCQNPRAWTVAVLTHWNLNYFFGFTTLSGDRWAVFSGMADIRNACVTTAQEPTEDIWLAPNETIYYSATTFGFSVPRAHGRTTRVKAHCVTLLDEGPIATEISRQNLIRNKYLRDWKMTGGTIPTFRERASSPRTTEWLGGEPGDLDAEWSKTIPNTGYFTADGWTPWHTGILCAGVYAAIRAAEHLSTSEIPDIEAMRSASYEVVRKAAKSVLVWGARKNAQTNNVWQTFYACDYYWTRVPATRGKALDGSGDTWDHTAINPQSGERYFRPGDDGWTRWSIGGYMLAPILNPGDPEVLSSLEKVDESNPLYMFPLRSQRGDSLTQYPYGFGDYGESWLEWGSIIPNAFSRYSGSGDTLYARGTSRCGFESYANGTHTGPTSLPASGTSAIAFGSFATGSIGTLTLPASGTCPVGFQSIATGTVSDTTHDASGTSAIVFETEDASILSLPASATSAIEFGTEESGGVITHYAYSIRYEFDAISFGSEATPGTLYSEASGTSAISFGSAGTGETRRTTGTADTTGGPTVVSTGTDPRLSRILLFRIGDRILRLPFRWFR